MRLKDIKLVTFDVTNTLLRFKIPPWKQYGNVARKYGFTGTDDMLGERFIYKYKSMWQTYPNFGKNSNMTWENWWHEIVRYTLSSGMSPSVDIDAITTKLIQDYERASSWLCTDGTIQTLKYLKEKHITLGIISNFDPRLHKVLKNVNLLEYFDFILISYEVGYCKPDKRIFNKAILKSKISGLTSAHCLHIGDDMIKDYKGALAAGWHALLINDHQEFVGNNLLPVEHMIPHLTYLMTIIQ